MALNIVTSAQPLTINHLITFIYGDPGVWKTSLAFTAKNPILFDFDKGAYRAANRKDTVQIGAWSEVANINANDLQGYDTIIIDTVGEALSTVIDGMRKTHPKAFQADGNLNQKGYGTMASIFAAWLRTLKGFGKDLVLLAHMKEETKNDKSKIRPDVLGNSKSLIYKMADLMGYMQVVEFTENGTTRNERVLDFRPNEVFLAKDSGGIGYIVAQKVAEHPTQLADVIQQTKDRINSLSEEQKQVMQDLEDIRAKLLEVETVGQLNEVKDSLPSAHYFLVQMQQAIASRMNEIGAIYNPQSDKFELPQVVENA